MTETSEPTGFCFCGCKAAVGYGRFFAQGHDKMAEAAFIAIHHDGSVAQHLTAHGYGPNNSVTAAAVKAGVWQECPRPSCDYVGAPASIRNHLNKHKQES